MALLIYSMTTSLDGIIADEQGGISWSAPDEEVHRFVNDVQRQIGTYLFGRRVYEVMTIWDTPEAIGGDAAGDGSELPAFVLEYADVWRSIDKIVYSRTLDDVSTKRTRLEREFDPDAVRQLKATASRALGIGGAELAGVALKAGLVDEIHQFVAPVTVGGGTRFLPDGLRIDLDLLDERRFDSGTVYLRYRVAQADVVTKSS
jgi:dihydrofolate reductase